MEETEYKQIEKTDKISWNHFFRQVLVAMIIWAAFINAGMAMGNITVAIPQLRREANSTEVVSNEMASWLTSSPSFSASVSIFIVIPVGHFMGRKFTMIIISVTHLIASSIMFFSDAAIHLLVSQIIFGLTVAAASSVFLLILSEYPSPKYRGLFLTIKSATYFWGMWIANAIGIFTNYRYTGLVGIFFSSCSLIMSLIIPESPYWLAFKRRYDECAAAHRWLKGVNEDTEKELDELIKTQKETDENVDSAKALWKYSKKCITAIRQPDLFKPLMLSVLVCSVYTLSGKYVCAVYAIEMMKKFTGNQSTVYIGVLILDGFTVLGMYVGCALSKILKRRTLLFPTSIFGTTVLFAMGVYLYLIKLSVFPKNDYVIIAMLVGYSVAICCGPMIMSTTISAELLPVRFRSLCVCIYALLTILLTGIIIKLSPYVFNSVGFHGTYLGFGVCSTIIIILMYKYLPETKDRTLHEIAYMFKPKKLRESKQQQLELLSR